MTVIESAINIEKYPGYNYNQNHENNDDDYTSARERYNVIPVVQLLIDCGANLDHRDRVCNYFICILFQSELTIIIYTLRRVGQHFNSLFLYDIFLLMLKSCGTLLHIQNSLFLRF